MPNPMHLSKWWLVIWACSTVAEAMDGRQSATCVAHADMSYRDMVRGVLVVRDSLGAAERALADRILSFSDGTGDQPVWKHPEDDDNLLYLYPPAETAPLRTMSRLAMPHGLDPTIDAVVLELDWGW